jgi:hypothetical protein
MALVVIQEQRGLVLDHSEKIYVYLHAYTYVYAQNIILTMALWDRWIPFPEEETGNTEGVWKGQVNDRYLWQCVLLSRQQKAHHEVSGDVEMFRPHSQKNDSFMYLPSFAHKSLLEPLKFLCLHY